MSITAAEGDISPEHENIVRKYFDGDLDNDQVSQELFEMTYNRLAEGLNDGWKQGTKDDHLKLMLELKTNVAVFSAFKSHSQGAEYVNLLVDENGEKRSWFEFRKRAIDIDQEYNRTWLEAEFNMATRQARAAEQWTNFVEQSSVYPNLEYMPSQAADPSDDHTKYYGIIKPINDPFWNTALPPSRWGCKCWVKQSKDAPTSTAVEAPLPLPGIEGNPGKSGRVFSATTPFVTGSTPEAKKLIKQNLKLLRNPLTDYVEMKVGKQVLKVHVNADVKDISENIQFIAPAMQKFKRNWQIRENVNNNKNPEFADGDVIGDLRSWYKSKDAYSFVQEAWSDKYQVQLKKYPEVFIALDFNKKLNASNATAALNGLNGKLKLSGRCQYVILKNNDIYVLIKPSDLNTAEKIEKTKKELLK